ncbi:hypothetical protein ORG27_06070 [Stenotrophomonas lactitubi]|uniref:hypothetical protein n=1 Tax=Stenotrophomonas lactitubi TaxID=2045214 RepID=UPI002248776E|nr:hypothetical protein [Stenotrophomonas lactitubi]MCX2893140.1 hypothetical protein [Stenotrophomonas lactitubi]
MIFVIRLTARACDGISALPERWTEESRATRGLFFAYCSATGVTARFALLFLPGLLLDTWLCILLKLLFLLALLAVLLLVTAQFVAIGLALRVVVHVLLHRSDLLQRHCVRRPVTQLHRIAPIMNSRHEQPLMHTGC